MTTYFGFAMSDSMFPPAIAVTRKSITANAVRVAIAHGAVAILNARHGATIDAMNTRYDLHIDIPATPPKVALAAGDELIVMTHDLPRLTEAREYTAAEIEAADFRFGVWTVYDVCPGCFFILEAGDRECAACEACEQDGLDELLDSAIPF